MSNLLDKEVKVSEPATSQKTLVYNLVHDTTNALSRIKHGNEFIERNNLRNLTKEELVLLVEKLVTNYSKNYTEYCQAIDTYYIQLTENKYI